MLDFVYIGTGRAGSTWLYTMFREHPEVFVPIKLKETHFFNRNYHRGLEYYHQFFNERTNEKIVGEIDPTYLSNLDAIKRIKDYAPNAKIIITLRNPIERAWSSYNGYIQKKEIPQKMTLFEFEEKNSAKPIQGGFYFENVKQVFDSFDRNQILIQLYDDFVANQLKYYQKICKFIDIDPDYIPENFNKKILEGKKFNPFLKSLFWINNKILSEKIRNKIHTDYYLKKIRIRYGRKRDSVPKDLKQKLLEIYRDDIDKLSKLMNRDLNSWKINIK